MKKLFIAWQDPDTRHWMPVGRLTLEDGVYKFVYTQGSLVSERFTPFGPMQDLYAVYESKDLFPLFANRLLSRNRPEYRQYLVWLNVQGEIGDPLDELARTGGIRATDSLVVFPRPEADRDGTYGVTFFGHGLRYLPSEAQKWVEQLQPGTPLYLMLDNQNAQDSMAIAMRSEPVMVVGYVPRYFTEDFRKLLTSKFGNTVRARVEKINLEAPIQLRLLCSIKANWPEDFRPCSGDLYSPLT